MILKKACFLNHFFLEYFQTKGFDMISFLNKLGNSWFAKLIFALLGISMLAFWGLGGLSNLGQSDTTALTVGNRAVSMQELGRSFDRERNKMAKISGGYMTPKNAIRAGLLDQVVQQLTLRELNAQIREELGLTASDAAVRAYIEKNPVFANQVGKFDANLFYAYLSQLNLSQAELARQMRAELANQHLMRTLLRIVPRDPALMERAARSKKEKREIEAVFLESKKMSVGSATEQELKDYYEAYMEEFSVPEYRKVRLVTLKMSDFKNDYESMTKKVRELEDALGGGQTLKQACDSLSLTPGQIITTDINGHDEHGKAQDILQPLMQEIFSLSEGEATALTEIENGFMVAGLEHITPQTYKSFPTVKRKVTELWVQEQQKEALIKAVDALKNTVKSGKGWQNYTPQKGTISYTETGKYPPKMAEALLQQAVGSENVTVYPAEQGTWVAVVKRVLPSKEKATQEEQTAAVTDWTQDLMHALQQAYAAKYPIDIRVNAIQKAFSVYDNQSE